MCVIKWNIAENVRTPDSLNNGVVMPSYNTIKKIPIFVTLMFKFLIKPQIKPIIAQEIIPINA